MLFCSLATSSRFVCQIMLSELPRQDSSDSSPKYVACNLLGVSVSAVKALSSGGTSAGRDGASGGIGRRRTQAKKCLKLHLGPKKRLPSLQAIKEPMANINKANSTKASTLGAVGLGWYVLVVGILILGAYVESWLGMEPSGKSPFTLYQTAEKCDSLVSEKNFTVIQLVIVRERGGDVTPPNLHTSPSEFLQHFAVLVGSVKLAFSSET